MAFIGNRSGPRESLVVSTLGYDYFGITPAQLADDIAMFEDSERRGEIVPVYEDADARYYLLLSAHGLTVRRCYLDEHGWKLTGEVSTRHEQTFEMTTFDPDEP